MTPPFWPAPAPYAGTTLDPGPDPLLLLLLVGVALALMLAYIGGMVALGLLWPVRRGPR